MSPPAVRVRVREDLDGIEAVTLYEAVDELGRPVEGPRVALVGRMHGNEPVGEVVVERFAASAAGRLVAGSVLTVLANLDARALDLRHTPDGVDMNRLWDADRLAALAAADPATLVSEARRVRALAPAMLACDAVLDLHSTSRPSPPHLLYRDDLRHAEVAARLGVARLVTGVHEHAVLDGGVCANLGLRPGEPGRRLGFTLEAGQHLHPGNLDAAWEVTVRLLVALGVWSEDVPPSEVAPEVFDVIERVRQAPPGTPPWRFVGWDGGEPGGGRRGPVRRLASFEAVEADEIVLRRDDGDVIRAEAPFTMLMPAPTAGPGEDLYFVAQRRHLAPESRPATHGAARAEAHAVERLLDVIAWDEAERGAVVVGTTSRRTLDLCAELVGRACRLPTGHPHRRLTVIGRGHDVGDEADRRASHRLESALRRARIDGVPIERIQLLRGASLAGLRARVDEDPPLRFSLTQPSALAAVIVGDVDAALASCELRHVAVGLVVETTAPEADGDEVHVRADRAGLFGARPELLRVAVELRDALRAEHGLVVRTGMLGVAGAEGPLGDVDARGALADAIVALQERRWRAVLRQVVTRPQILERGALGAWLARVMAATGILDVDTLRGWLVTPTEGGWSIDPARLADAPPVVAASPALRLPEPVIEARQVDRDDVERFLGWRRWLREAEVLSGDRGRDVELSTAGARTHERLAGWLDDAREQAAARPGEVMVVVAGDGFAPRDVPEAGAGVLLRAHRELLLDPAVRYLRVLHGPGSHLAWVKDLVSLVGLRPPGAPVALGWEGEHGGSVHVLLVCTRAGEPGDGWSLEPWRIERCAVVLARGPGVDGPPLSLLTETSPDGRIHQELVHFGRRHVQGLMRRATWRFVGQGGPASRLHLEAGARQLLAEQIGRLATQLDLLAGVDDAGRAAWAAHRVGVHDPGLVAALVAAARSGEPPEAAARRIWADVDAWPGERLARPIRETVDVT
jgi:hypothetical protein